MPPAGQLVAARLEDAERLALLSQAAKRTYREWAPPGWQPPSLDAERARWARRLTERAGWTLIALDPAGALGTIHFTDARADHGTGKAIIGRANLSGLFVSPARWGEGVGSALLDAAVAELRSRGYQSAQLFTATANRRSRSFYERRGWRATDLDTHKHDDLWVVRYELRPE